MKLVAATNNNHKIDEMRAILGELGIEVISQKDIGLNIDVDETGSTFEENAIIKARAIMQLCQLPSISDDSGLCVDALDGRPGIYSARYAGAGATSDMLVGKLLGELKGKQIRTARFVCAVAFFMPNGKRYTQEGIIEGSIATQSCGDGGFGYDSVFIPQGYDITFAQMDENEKNKLSHRYQALIKLKDILKINL